MMRYKDANECLMAAMAACLATPKVYRKVIRMAHDRRNAYATHCLNGGHANLETTMGYLHAEALSVRSPLETTSFNSHD